MKVLLIDDMAHKGWLQLLTKVFPIEGMEMHSATNVKITEEKLNIKYDIIFLDVRIEREDHFHRDIENYSGFKVLKMIKANFLNPNFSTPIILITASNKIWSINKFLDYGVDAYYIKEHPDSVFNKETSKMNYDNLKEDFNRLLELGPKRDTVWIASRQIIDAVTSHKYFNDSSGYVNVKDRIISKVKLGYYYRFKGQNTLEREVLKVDNENISFLIYFSILEELVKGYTEKSTWISDKKTFSGDWKFRNNKYFIYKENNSFNVKPFWDKKNHKYFSKFKPFPIKKDKKYSKGYIKLSEQIYALIYHFNIDNKFKNKFKDLNDYRNKLNYTHSSVAAIFEEPLVSKSYKSNIEDKIKDILSLIEEILRHPK